MQTGLMGLLPKEKPADVAIDLSSPESSSTRAQHASEPCSTNRESEFQIREAAHGPCGSIRRVRRGGDVERSLTFGVSRLM